MLFTAPPAVRTPRPVMNGSTIGPGKRGGSQDRVYLSAEAAARHEHQPLAQLGELIGELHHDAAAQRVTDEGRTLVPEGDQQVADSARVGAE